MGNLEWQNTVSCYLSALLSRKMWFTQPPRRQWIVMRQLSGWRRSASYYLMQCPVKCRVGVFQAGRPFNYNSITQRKTHSCTFFWEIQEAAKQSKGAAKHCYRKPSLPLLPITSQKLQKFHPAAYMCCCHTPSPRLYGNVWTHADSLVAFVRSLKVTNPLSHPRRTGPWLVLMFRDTHSRNCHGEESISGFTLPALLVWLPLLLHSSPSPQHFKHKPPSLSHFLFLHASWSVWCYSWGVTEGNTEPREPWACLNIKSCLSCFRGPMHAQLW